MYDMYESYTYITWELLDYDLTISRVSCEIYSNI